MRKNNTTGCAFQRSSKDRFRIGNRAGDTTSRSCKDTQYFIVTVMEYYLKTFYVIDLTFIPRLSKDFSSKL